MSQLALHQLRRRRTGPIPVRHAKCATFFFMMWICGASLALAQNPMPPDLQAIYERLDRQEAEIHALRERLSAQQPQPDGPVNGDQTLEASLPGFDPASYYSVANEQGGDKGDKGAAKAEKKDEWVDVSDEKWTVKLGGHVQLDYIMWPHSDPAIVDPEQGNYFNYRRLRLVADGTGYGQYDFRLQMTLEPGQGSDTNRFGSPDVKDAYLSMNDVPWFGRIRIGNFFVPFSLEQVTNDTNNIFLERSIPTQGIFSADREVGIASYNCVPDQTITWSGGVFFDDLSDTFKTRFDANQGYRLSGRVTWLPYYDEPSNGRYLVHTGLGLLYTDDQDDIVRFRARPQIQRGPILIDSGAIPADTYTTANTEFAIVWGAFTIQSEAFYSDVNLNTAGRAHAEGAYAHISYFLTGENRIFEKFGQHGAQFGRNKPFTNFFAVPAAIGSGAWEAKARWSYLDLTDMNRGQYNDLTVGFNWYWTDRTRIMFDWIHPMTSSQTVFGDTESDIIGTRFDFNW